MFIAPSLPPKDYVLRDVKQALLSTPEHTPDAAPRITQANLGLYCYPIPYRKNEKLTDIPVLPVNSKVLDIWADRARAFWISKPGVSDFLLHDIHKNYSVVVDPDYDPRYKHKERVFNRSYKYELDCLEFERLEKLKRKVIREEEEEDQITAARKKPEEDPIKLVPCKEQPPFWWKENEFQVPRPTKYEPEEKILLSSEKDCKRWMEEPDFLKPAKLNACQRRDEMLLVGQMFNSEACNWYYKNYPPPAVKFLPKRFA